MSDSTSPQTFDPKAFTKQLTASPGVYRMLASDGKVLYVGKAKHLKNRVSSYFVKQGLSLKTRSLVSKIADIEITLTASETEALILEQNLIKSLKPPYNILLRDDKSYPYIYLASDKEFPSLSLKRARTKGKTGQYFGPFPSAGSVKESLNILEKIFKVRQCQESFFSNRSRPCLQYQIKRCKAPCVGLVDVEEYRQDVNKVVMFLQGRSPELLRQLIDDMEASAAALDFEKAAELRDQITHLRHVQESQSAESGSQNLDVIAMSEAPGTTAISMLFIRQGRILGHKNYFPKLPLDLDEEQRLSAYVEHYYIGQNQSRDIPPEIVLPMPLSNQPLISDALESLLNRRVKFSSQVKTIRAQWQKLAKANADNALKSHLESRDNVFKRMEALQRLLKLDTLPKRMECFDISHSSGEKTVGSCVVFNDHGPQKSEYRSFNIEGIQAGDDYAAMRQVLTRRYRDLDMSSAKRPDVIFIDGGKGQLNLAVEVINTLNLRDLKLVGIAKGVTRKAGFETLLIPTDNEELAVVNCSSDNPGLHLIQQIRDEAHRFAITSHRKRRDKARKQSGLDAIAGVGPKRRSELLRYFGSVAALKKASSQEIAKVSGINQTLAEHIYLSLHGE